jgi:hypothetical protein
LLSCTNATGAGKGDPCGDDEDCVGDLVCSAVNGTCQTPDRNGEAPNGGDGPGADAGPVQDAGSPVDSGGQTNPDGGLNLDAGPLADAGPSPDAGALADSGFVPDSGDDSGPPAESGIPPADGGDPTPPDSGPPDAGPLTDGGVVPMTWWDPGYAHRMQLLISPLDGDLKKDYPIRFRFDHDTLESNYGARANGNDLRVLCWNGAGWVEMPRRLVEDSNWNNSDTEIMTRTFRDVVAPEVIDECYLYFGNSQAADTAPTDVPPSRTFQVIQGGSRLDNDVVWENIIDLDVEVTRPNEHWVVFAMWQMQHDGNANSIQTQGEVQLLRNGMPIPGTVRLSRREGGDRWRSQGTFVHLTDVTGIQNIQMQFRSDANSVDRLQSARLVAMLLPETQSSGLTHATVADPDLDTTTTDLATLTVGDSSGDDWIWFATGATHQAPSTQGQNELRAMLGGTETRQMTEEAYFDLSDSGYSTLIHVDRVSLMAPTDLSVQHAVDGASGSERQGIRNIAFRASAFAQVDSDRNASTEVNVGTIFDSTLQKVFPADVGREQDCIALAVATTDVNLQNSTVGAEFRIELDGNTELTDEVQHTANDHPTQTAWAQAFRDDGGREIKIQHRSTGIGQGAKTLYAQLLQLRYKEATATFGAVENVP